MPENVEYVERDLRFELRSVVRQENSSEREVVIAAFNQREDARFFASQIYAAGWRIYEKSPPGYQRWTLMETSDDGGQKVNSRR